MDEVSIEGEDTFAEREPTIRRWLQQRRSVCYTSSDVELMLGEINRLRTCLSAVLHQLQDGEASDLLAGERTRPDAVRDLCWCRDHIRETLASA